MKDSRQFLPGESPSCFSLSGGVPVNPGMDFAFFPSQVLADPVGGQVPFPPFLADGPFGDGNIAATSRADSMRFEPPRVPARSRARCW